MASGRRSLAHRRRRVFSAHHDSWFDQHLPEHFALLDQAQAFIGVFEAEFLVDDGLYFALGDQVKQLKQILAQPTIGAEDLQLKSPYKPQVLLGIEAGRGATCQDTTLTVQHPEARHPGVAAGIVDHDVNAASEPTPVRLTVSLV